MPKKQHLLATIPYKITFLKTDTNKLYIYEDRIIISYDHLRNKERKYVKEAIANEAKNLIKIHKHHTCNKVEQIIEIDIEDFDINI